MNSIRVGWGDSGQLIVGEWGITQQDYQQDSSRLSNLYNRLRPYPDWMFFFSHHVHDEEDVGTWGLRNFTTDAGTSGPPGRYVLLGQSNLYGPYDQLVGG